MAQPDDQNNSGLRVSGYGPRLRQTLVIVGALAVIVIAIILAALWANSREPDVGVQPTPRPTRPPEPTATTVPPTDTATPEPTETPVVKIPDTATPTATNTPQPTEVAPENPTPAETETPVPEIAPTAEPTVAPTNTPTPIPPTAEPAPTATNTPQPTATPTARPTPAPTATPTVTPTPAPMVPTRLEIYARGQLIDQGIEQGDLKILSVTEHVWPDTTLGCGYVEGNNPAKAVDGWILELGNEDKVYSKATITYPKTLSQTAPTSKIEFNQPSTSSMTSDCTKHGVPSCTAARPARKRNRFKTSTIQHWSSFSSTP